MTNILIFEGSLLTVSGWIPRGYVWITEAYYGSNFGSTEITKYLTTETRRAQRKQEYI